MLIGFDFTRHQEVHNSFFGEFVGTRNGLQTLRICSWSPQIIFVCVTSTFQNHIFQNNLSTKRNFIRRLFSIIFPGNVFDLIFINNIFDLCFSMTFVDLHFLQLLNISTKMISPFQICQQRFPDHISSFHQAIFLISSK